MGVSKKGDKESDSGKAVTAAPKKKGSGVAADEVVVNKGGLSSAAKASLDGGDSAKDKSAKSKSDAVEAKQKERGKDKAASAAGGSDSAKKGDDSKSEKDSVTKKADSKKEAPAKGDAKGKGDEGKGAAKGGKEASKKEVAAKDKPLAKNAEKGKAKMALAKKKVRASNGRSVLAHLDLDVTALCRTPADSQGRVTVNPPFPPLASCLPGRGMIARFSTRQHACIVVCLCPLKTDRRSCQCLAVSLAHTGLVNKMSVHTCTVQA